MNSTIYSQHGFHSGRSTFSAISTTHEKCIDDKENEKTHQAVSFLDLSSAFDTSSKDVIAEKLRALGFNKNSVNWIETYLSSRSQCVMIGSTISEPCQFRCWFTSRSYPLTHHIPHACLRCRLMVPRNSYVTVSMQMTLPAQ